MIKRFFRELYMLPRGERRAIVLLSFLLVLSIMARVIVQALPDRESPGLNEFVNQAREILQAKEEADSLHQSLILPSPDRYLKLPPIGPDPSSNLNPNLYLNPKPTIPESRLAVIDINRADSAGLLPLPGIGPVFAGRIIKYRKLLGGFVSVDQLNEVYGLAGETVNLITPYIHVDSSCIQKLRLNSASFRELLKHPYLSFEDVKSLIRFREVEGRIGSQREIREHGLLHDSILERTVPYMDFSDRPGGGN